MLNELKLHPGTYFLFLTNIIAYLFLEYKGGTEGIYGQINLIKYGARYGPAIIQGEWWRLVVPIFLHIGIFHIFTNLVGLLIIGRITEKIFGSLGYVVIYFLTGIIGNICSFYFSPNIGAGASGAIFGLFGTYIAYLFINRSYLGRVGKDMLLSVLFIVLVNIFFGLFSNGIDNTAHFCGLISGLVIGFYVIPSLKSYRFRWVGNSKVSIFYSNLFRYLFCSFVTYIFAVIIVNIKSNLGY